MAQTVNLTADQGATFRVTLNAKNPDGTAQDLTNCTAEMMIRSTYSAASPIVTLSTTVAAGAEPNIALGGTAGTVDLYLSAAATLAIPVKYTNAIPPIQSYVYDIDITYPSGDTDRLAQGSFVVTATVTR